MISNMKYLITTVFLSLTFSTSSFAYDGKKCWKNVFLGPPQALYKGLGGKDHRDGWLLKLFGTTTGSVGSTVSFIFSTGSCSAIAQVEKEKFMFIAMNHRKVQSEAALGEGETLDALAYFYGQQQCVQNFKSILKDNYSEIFTDINNLGEIDTSIRKHIKHQSKCQS